MVPVWVNIPNLVLHLWSGSAPNIIASLVGTPFYADRFTAVKIEYYMQLLIEVDVRRDFPREVPFFCSNGRPYIQEVLRICSIRELLSTSFRNLTNNILLRYLWLISEYEDD